jgi:integral membrane protein
MLSFKSSLASFRSVALLEGISFLVLLGIAMPLKYYAGMPQAVKVVGWAHGVLFVAYILTLVSVTIERRWSFGRVVIAFIASLVPFGTFWLDAKLKREEQNIAA